jgi:chemotaxis protein CheX
MPGFEQDLAEIVDGVWRSVFGASVALEDPFRLSARNDPTVAGLVRISGAWDGYLALQCTPAVARQAAAALRPGDPAPVRRTDLDDALGELTNLIAGDFKALLPKRCDLAPPSVRDTIGYHLRLPAAAQVLQGSFRCGEEVFTVTLLQTLPANISV